MPRPFSWQQLLEGARYIDGEFEKRDEPVGFEGDLRDWRRSAERRATNTLLDAIDPEHQRYNHDVRFKHTINLLVQVVVAGVFDEAPITQKERDERRQAAFDIEAIMLEGLREAQGGG